MDKNKKFILVLMFTFASVLSVFFIRLHGFDGSLFRVYTILVTSYLVFIYICSYAYKPVPDLGYRPSVSIIIPAKNEEKAIQNCINHALDSNYPQDKLEIIVIDDGSTDRTTEKIKELLSDGAKSGRITFIKHKKNRGKREAMASGIRIAKGEILVSIDSDSFVDKDAIKHLVQPFTNNEITAVCGHGCVYNKNQNLLTKLQHYWYQEMFYIVKGMEAKLGCVNCCSGILAAYRKKTILPILDEWLEQNFFGIPIIISDDRHLTNLSLRGLAGVNGYKNSKNGNGKMIGNKIDSILSTRDAKVTYQSNAIVYTIAPDNMKQFIKQQVRWKRGSLHGTLYGSKFMWKKPFPIPLYFYLYMYLTYITPIIIFRWLVLKPLNGEWFGAVAFMAGVLYVGFLHGLNVWKYDNDSDNIIYRSIFGFMSIFLTAIVLPYAVVTLWRNGWITRSGADVRQNKTIY
jgi:hyaluronan synthase